MHDCPPVRVGNRRAIGNLTSSERSGRNASLGCTYGNGRLSGFDLRPRWFANPAEWHEKVFRNTRVGDYYAKASTGVRPYLAKLFMNARPQRFTQAHADRLENICDNNATEDTYEMLIKRQEPIPIYKLRIMNGK